MADFKKDKKKEPAAELKPLGSSNPWEFLIIAGILIILLSYAVANFSNFLGSNSLTRSLRIDQLLNNIKLWWQIALPYLKILSFLLSSLLVYAIISTSFKLSKLQKRESEKYAPTPAQLEASESQTSMVVPNPAAKKWERVVKHIESVNPNDWKIAIIEADAILDEMVDSMGYHGETLGEKLKAIEQSDFTTIKKAWEAHKVRNLIAHEASFQMDEREARRVVALYQSVFEEFRYI